VGKISVYVRNKNLTPSSYYRVIQYTSKFQEDILVREIAPNFIYKLKRGHSSQNPLMRISIDLIYYLTMLIRVLSFLVIDNILVPKAIIVSKTFCPRYNPSLLLILINRLVKKVPLYWDFDDHIFISGEMPYKQKIILEEHSQSIIVTNTFLKSKIDTKFQYKVCILPTTDGDLQGFDIENLLHERLKSYNKEVKLVWVATSGNIIHLKTVISVLDEAAKIIGDQYNKNLTLNVVCDKPIECKTNNLIIKNIKWTREIAKEEIYNSHVGIMPLINNDYTKGKGGFKLVQYISTGLPVIASNVGYNQQVVSQNCGFLIEESADHKGWINAIIELGSNSEKWSKFSKSAYSVWNEEFSFSKNLEQWQSLIQDKK